MKTVTTPKAKIRVELKEDINGMEWSEIQKPMNDFTFELQGDGKTKGIFNAGQARRESVQKAIEIVVQSVAGEKDRILERVGELSVQDYRHILKCVDDVVSATDEDFLESGKAPDSGTD